MTGDVKSEIKDGIKVDNSTIKAAAGIYTVTFSTDAIGELSGEKDTVIALVLPEHLTAQDFTVKVKDVEDGLSDQILMEKAQVQAWNGDDQTNLVENVGVDKNQSDEIKAAAGQYKLTFTTPAGTQKTVTVTVESPSSPYTPVTPTVVPGTTPDPNPGDTPIDTDNPGGEGGTQIEKLDSSKDEVNKVIVPDSESKVPRTGDNDIIFLWIFLILLSGIVGCAAALTTDEKAPRQGRNRRFFRKNKKN
jgi:hypothetical protein